MRVLSKLPAILALAAVLMIGDTALAQGPGMCCHGGSGSRSGGGNSPQLMQMQQMMNYQRYAMQMQQAQQYQLQLQAQQQVLAQLQAQQLNALAQQRALQMQRLQAGQNNQLNANLNRAAGR